MTINQFINKYNISADINEDRNNDIPKDDWRNTKNHYRVTLIYRDGLTVAMLNPPKHLTCWFYANDEPELAEVLDCLASDASSIENNPEFEEWANELGYDTDSRRAEATFNECEEQTDKLIKFLPNRQSYEELLWHTERI